MKTLIGYIKQKYHWVYLNLFKSLIFILYIFMIASSKSKTMPFEYKILWLIKIYYFF